MFIVDFHIDDTADRFIALLISSSYLLFLNKILNEISSFYFQIKIRKRKFYHFVSIPAQDFFLKHARVRISQQWSNLARQHRLIHRIQVS